MFDSFNQRKNDKQPNNTINYSVRYYENPVIIDHRINNSGFFNSGVRAVASSIYELYFNTRKASEFNDDFYDYKRKDHYIIFKNDQIKRIKCFSNNAISKAKKLLKQLNLIKVVHQKWNQPDRIYLTNFNHVFSFISGKTPGCSTAKSRNNKTSKIKTTKTINNTKVNTKTAQNNSKFKCMDSTSSWADSAETLGLTVDTINHIAKFSDTYGKSAYQITKLIIEARDIIANKHHISKNIRGFDTNDNIKRSLGNKIYKLLTDIVRPSYHKAKLTNFAGWFINSLKHFFMSAFGLQKDKPSVKPIVDNHRPIKESLPNWAKKGYKPKLKKPNARLAALCKKDLEHVNQPPTKVGGMFPNSPQ